MIKKILITLGIIVSYRLISFIPLPGINIGALQKFFNTIATNQNGTLFGISGIIGNGAMQRLTIFPLGLMPYLSSCIIIQLFGTFLPFLKQHYVRGGEEGREKIVKSTNYLTIALSAVQAFFISLWLENPNRFYGLNIVLSPGWGFRIMTIITLTAGVIFLLWLANLINRHGIGNGVAVLVMSGILSKFHAAIYQILSPYSKYYLGEIRLFILFATIIISVATVWFVTKASRKIPVSYQNSTLKTFIALRLSWPGKAPLAFAQTILILPVMMAAFIPFLGNAGASLLKNGWIYTILYSIAIVAFTYFYTAIVFHPKEIVKNMQKYDCYIENVNPGNETAKYLNNRMKKDTVVTALFLIIIAVFPDLCIKQLRLPHTAVRFIGGLSLMLMTGVFYDIKCQVEAYFSMKERLDVKKWGIAYIAFDEIEAEIKSGALEARGIPSVVEPLRFTWGMPIRTAMDQYRIYTPLDKVKLARSCL